MPVMAAVGALASSHVEMHQHMARDVAATGPVDTVAGGYTAQGCYSALASDMVEVKVDNTFLSSLKCSEACPKDKYAVFAMSPTKCYCGMEYPPKDDITDNSDCNYPCNGFPKEACGGKKGSYAVYNTGGDGFLAPDHESSSSSSSSSTATSSSTKSTGTATSTSATTATVTETQSTESAKPEKKSGGPNTAAIAAGVVVGVVVAAAIIGGIIFFMRRKRNAEIEEEHRRNAAVNAFISGSKPPSTSGGLSITDARLDPVMAHRRLSDGSIADNQDYSRKILRVR